MFSFFRLLFVITLLLVLAQGLSVMAQDEPTLPAEPTLENTPVPVEEPPPVDNPTFFTMERIVNILMIGLVAVILLFPVAMGLFFTFAFRLIPAYGRPAAREFVQGTLDQLGNYVRTTPSKEDDELFTWLEARLRPIIDKAAEDAAIQAVRRFEDRVVATASRAANQ